MPKIKVELSDHTAQQLKKMADSQSTSAESLIRDFTEEIVHQSNKEFEDIAHRILEKNKELYRRLA